MVVRGIFYFIVIIAYFSHEVTSDIEEVIEPGNNTGHHLSKVDDHFIVSVLPDTRSIKETETEIEFEIDDMDSSSEEGEKSKKHSKKRKGKSKPKDDDTDEDDSDCSDPESEEDNKKKKKSSKKNKKKGKKKRTKSTTARQGRVYLDETFSDRTWDTVWTYSTQADGGQEKKGFEKFYRVRSRRGRRGFDYGLATSNKGTNDYAISTVFDPLNWNDAPVVLQFAMQYQAPPHCEFVFLRLFDCKFKPAEFTPDTPYLVQLGPNLCGSAENSLSVVISDPLKGERYVLVENIPAVTSTDIHTYALIVHPDGNYHVFVNEKAVYNGSLTSIIPNYQTYPSICSVGVVVWHSILDKFFKGQIVIDDIIVTSDVSYAEKRRNEVLDLMGNSSTAGPDQ